jgi:hypothetical protein
VFPGEPVVEQGQVRPGKADVGRVARRRLHLVGLVEVVQPVPVDEPVLETNEPDAAAARLEGERAAPSAGLGVGDHHAGAQGIQRGRRLVHAPRGPGQLEVRDAEQVVGNNGPRIVAAEHRGPPDVVAGAERGEGAAPRAPDRQ